MNPTDSELPLQIDLKQASVDKYIALSVCAVERVTTVDSSIKPLFCGACDKSMWDRATGTNHVGMSFNWPSINPELIAPYKPGVVYQVCIPCWMKSLGIKP